MNTKLFSFLFATLISAKPVYACLPDLEADYDDIGSRTVSIATATVTSVDFASDENKSCWHISYSDVNYLYGSGGEEILVKSCVQEAYEYDVPEDVDESLVYLGLVPDAKVLMGLVPTGKDESQLRYAVPSCWGPLHINLNEMSPEEQNDLLLSIQNQVSNSQ